LGVKLLLHRNARVIQRDPAIGHCSEVCSHGGYTAVPPSHGQHRWDLCPCTPLVMLCNRHQRANLA